MSVKAFISSTYVDLKEHRAYVIERLNRGGIYVDPMEKWTASSDEPKAFSVERVRDCDLCILLVGFVRGHIPENETLSITQMEYREAIRKEIDVLIFMASEQADWPATSPTPADLDKDPAMKEWRSDLSEKHGVGFFTARPDSIDIDAPLIRWYEKRTKDLKANSDRPEISVNPIDIRTYSSQEGILIAWKTTQLIKGCLGFAIHRKTLEQTGITESILTNVVGFTDKIVPGWPAETSAKHPIQRFRWFDRPPKDQEVRYRVVPVKGHPENLVQAPENEGSSWSPWIARKTGHDKGFHVFFNRTTAYARFFAQRFRANAEVEKKIERAQRTRDQQVLDQMGGELRQYLLSLLFKAKLLNQQVYVYVARIDDADIIKALMALGKDLSIILDIPKTGGSSRPNLQKSPHHKLIRLLKSSSANIFVRQTTKRQSTRQNFAVFCDQWGASEQVWVGSAGWTLEALYLHDNFGIAIDSRQLSKAYLDSWKDIQHLDSANYISNQQARPMLEQIRADAIFITRWNTPVKKNADLKDVSRLISGAREGILFLINQKSISKTLLDKIIHPEGDGLFIQGISYKPSRAADQKIDLHGLASFQGINRNNNFNSTIIVLDPFGPHPVVIIDPHNLSAKTSSQKISDLLIIENATGLAIEYAIHLIRLYDVHRYRNNISSSGKTGWQGLIPNDAWQKPYFNVASQSQLNFLFGSLWPGL